MFVAGTYSDSASAETVRITRLGVAVLSWASRAYGQRKSELGLPDALPLPAMTRRLSSRTA